MLALLNVSYAQTTAWVRFVEPILARMLRTWVRTAIYRARTSASGLNLILLQVRMSLAALPAQAVVRLVYLAVGITVRTQS